MKQRVLLVHGWGGSDNPHWQSWLAAEIARDYGCVSFLKLSNFEFPHINLWKQELLKELNNFNPTIIICHSLANILWFHLCNEENIAEVEKLFLVSPPSLNSQIDELKNFFPVAAPKKLYAKEVLLVCSTNDPYMELDEAKSLKKELNVKMEILENAGHINADSGFGPWPWMLNKLK
ncbi:RBBP9/YdeN family alpha/beta hydrolase [Sulfurimonas sp. CS5]|jgi:predicted alpha/beta hydrolase family esterase|uniref:RBBP9/YdeN family alpha/beta hydrolase n=1 Tax=Sulfurimonas sp. CS5 TaxID=3391145 RepID=UPI0039E87022